MGSVRRGGRLACGKAEQWEADCTLNSDQSLYRSDLNFHVLWKAGDLGPGKGWRSVPWKERRLKMYPCPCYQWSILVVVPRSSRHGSLSKHVSVLTFLPRATLWRCRARFCIWVLDESGAKAELHQGQDLKNLILQISKSMDNNNTPYSILSGQLSRQHIFVTH